MPYWSSRVTEATGTRAQWLETGRNLLGAMWENVRIRMSEVGKEKDIQWGEGLGVFAQSMRPAEEKTKCLEILGRQDLRLPQGSGVSLLGMSTISSTLTQHTGSAAEIGLA